MNVEHLIGAEWRPSADGARFDTHDPHDGALLASVAAGGAEEATAAVGAARRAFDEGPWPRMTAAERQTSLHAFADLVDRDAEELALLDTRDMGKPIRESRAMDLPRVSRNLRFFADYAAMAGSEAYPDGLRMSYVLYPPAGVVVAISPWNFPAMQASWKIAPALAFGNTVVLKPAEQSPLSAARLGALALEAGLPAGVLNVVQGFGPDAVGEALTRDPRVDRITFTGESATGRAISGAAAANLIPVSCELGGRSANVVFDDADLDEAVAGAIRGIFTNNGEVCLAGSRLLVQRGVHDAFVERFVAAAEALRVGDPKDPATQVGPLVEAKHREKVDGYVRLGLAEGGTLLTGGGAPADPALAGGHYYAPTVLGGMDNTSGRCRSWCRSTTRPTRCGSPTTRPTASPGCCGPTTSTAACGWRRRGGPAWCGSTASSSATCGCRSAARRPAASAARAGVTRASSSPTRARS
jgi:aminomuconate-semialdehyde/2-hydroxymuconate-6-semialdehyde dehydrogenase